MSTMMKTSAWLGLLTTAMLIGPMEVAAHCDSLDGPVVQAAIQALETGDLAHVLIWVQPDDEPEIREAFQRTLSVRDRGSDARELADRWFFETVVRIHRAGEGAPFTGLKPAGYEPTPGIAEADRAVENGSLTALETTLAGRLKTELEARFETLQRRDDHDPGDLEAGRAYVAAYVEFIHFVEEIHALLGHEGPSHHDDGAGDVHFDPDA